MNAPDGPPRDRIRVQDLLLRCVIGIEAWERKTKQDVLVGFTLFLDLAPAGLSDRVEETVDYKQLTKRIIARAEGVSFFLIEALAEEIARLCLEEKKVAAVAVRVEKPGALRFARTVAVEIHRGRSGP